MPGVGASGAVTELAVDLLAGRNPYVADLIRRERRRERRTSPAPEPVEYEVKRVDFSKTLPVEMMAEVSDEV